MYTFWNSRIDRVYVLNGAKVDGPLPVQAATLEPDHTIRLAAPTSPPPRPPFAVAGTGAALAGAPRPAAVVAG